ncbi:hypothetical protein X777_07882 [Ooceraea biroi]|uniref:Uncharacterized protein n=1 Tax=Ooceraea biroi TaxID=2015173 RepID=A0A026X2D1_OOCBI|nr:hypothetical protein X777_07882 [Ooceraea biroi]
MNFKSEIGLGGTRHGFWRGEGRSGLKNEHCEGGGRNHDKKSMTYARGVSAIFRLLVSFSRQRSKFHR